MRLQNHLPIKLAWGILATGPFSLAVKLLWLEVILIGLADLTLTIRDSKKQSYLYNLILCFVLVIEPWPMLRLAHNSEVLVGISVQHVNAVYIWFCFLQAKCSMYYALCEILITRAMAM